MENLILNKRFFKVFTIIQPQYKAEELFDFVVLMPWDIQEPKIPFTGNALTPLSFSGESF